MFEIFKIQILYPIFTRCTCLKYLTISYVSNSNVTHVTTVSNDSNTEV